MSISVILCTYASPRSLGLVLAGLLRQSVLPDQLIVADDGSGEETAAVVALHAAASPIAFHHLWQADHGVQKAGIVNAALAIARGEQVLFLDGDMVPHRHWVRDHAARFDGRTVWQGRRVRLRRRWGEQLTAERIAAGWLDSFRSRFLFEGFVRGEVRKYHLAIPLPYAVTRLAEKRKGLMGCNYSAPRSVLEAVNGYDAGWEGAGLLCEDLDLEIRLRREGFRLRPILHAGIAFHLDHTHRPLSERALWLRAERAAVENSRAADGIVEARARLASGEVLDRLVD
ncbi:MAG: glycosyltransferase [Deltaproteobacteria bacterium]